jgi:hypothetical protein
MNMFRRPFLLSILFLAPSSVLAQSGTATAGGAVSAAAAVAKCLRAALTTYQVRWQEDLVAMNAQIANDTNWVRLACGSPGPNATAANCSNAQKKRASDKAYLAKEGSLEWQLYQSNAQACRTGKPASPVALGPAPAPGGSTAPPVLPSPGNAPSGSTNNKSWQKHLQPTN